MALARIAGGARNFPLSQLWGISSSRGTAGAATAALVGRLEQELSSIKSGGTWKTEHVITSPQDVSIKVDGHDGGILNFCANNYLGLSVI